VRTLGSLGFTLVFLATAGCDKAPAPAPSASGTTAAPASAAPVATAPPLPTTSPSDIDVPSLRKKLGCTDARRALCRVLAEFADAAPFAPRIPSGEGRWIGSAYSSAKGADKPELTLLSVVQAPTSTVPTGELALRVGTGQVPDDKRDHGVKLASALARGDTVPRANQTAPYVKTWKPNDARGTMQTNGNSVRLVSEELFLRQTSTKVLTVRVKSTPSGGEDVTVAELWAVTW
jgi:hypothetical protein